MMRKWTLVPIFAAMAAITWAQPSQPPDRESDMESSAERRTRDARRGRQTPEPNAAVRRGQEPAPADPTVEKPVVQRMDPAQETPAFAPGTAATPNATGNLVRPDMTRPLPMDTAATPTASPGRTGDAESSAPSGIENIRQQLRRRNDTQTPSAPVDDTVNPGNTPAVGSPTIGTPSPGEGVRRPTPGTRPRVTPAGSPDAAPDPSASPRIRTTVTPDVSPVPVSTRVSEDASPSPGAMPDPIPADATPFVPTDMPERLRRDSEKRTPQPGSTATPDTAETPDTDASPDTDATPVTGETPDTDATPEIGVIRGTTPRAADATPSPRVTPTVSPSPRARVTPGISPAPGSSPAANAAKAAERRRKRLSDQANQPTIKASDATSENLNQAAELLLGPGSDKINKKERRDPATVKLTPWTSPQVVSDKEAVDTSVKSDAIVVMPPGATPTPTPAPERIVVSDPSTIINNIQNITIAPTPPPAPTPGATPVATPPGVTPVPANWQPEANWVPYPGWRPPNNWNPPDGWVPPGGWSPAPGWEPPREWVPRLRDWGWSYIASRGWVVPVQWTPPPDFVVPPDWYYMPPNAYDDYGFYDPSEVVVLPGRARPDLVVNINVTEVYTPPAPPPVILTEAPPPPPRPAPPMPPPVPAEMTVVENVVEVLTRPRQANAPRYEGPVLVTGSVHFAYDSFAIEPDSFPTLDAIGTALVEELPDSIINIEGHTDSDGSDEYNQQLSEQRAWSVKSYLVQRFGIDPNRLITVGYGERAPIADNSSDTGKARNRRAEFENVTDLYSAQVVDIETAAPTTAPPAEY